MIEILDRKTGEIVAKVETNDPKVRVYTFDDDRYMVFL
jgi:hypothetical protein